MILQEECIPHLVAIAKMSSPFKQSRFSLNNPDSVVEITSKIDSLHSRIDDIYNAIGGDGDLGTIGLADRLSTCEEKMSTIQYRIVAAAWVIISSIILLVISKTLW